MIETVLFTTRLQRLKSSLEKKNIGEALLFIDVWLKEYDQKIQDFERNHCGRFETS